LRCNCVHTAHLAGNQDTEDEVKLIKLNFPRVIDIEEIEDYFNFVCGEIGNVLHEEEELDICNNGGRHTYRDNMNRY
jgi:hypothetical protein